MVSAPVVARERGIHITETRKDAQGAFGSYMRLIVDHRGSRPARSPARSTPTASRASSRSRASTSRPSRCGSCSTPPTPTRPATSARSAPSSAPRRQHRHLRARPRAEERRGDRAPRRRRGDRHRQRWPRSRRCRRSARPRRCGSEPSGGADRGPPRPGRDDRKRSSRRARQAARVAAGQHVLGGVGVQQRLRASPGAPSRGRRTAISSPGTELGRRPRAARSRRRSRNEQQRRAGSRLLAVGRVADRSPSVAGRPGRAIASSRPGASRWSRMALQNSRRARRRRSARAARSARRPRHCRGHGPARGSAAGAAPAGSPGIRWR